MSNVVQFPINAHSLRLKTQGEVLRVEQGLLKRLEQAQISYCQEKTEASKESLRVCQDAYLSFIASIESIHDAVSRNAS